MGLSIRQAKISEGDDIRSFLHVVIPQSIDGLTHNIPDVVQNVSANLAMWIHAPSEVLHVIAEYNGRIVGSILVKHYWNLCSLFVHPDFQRIGIGTSLLLSALEQCRSKSPKRAIWLNADNDALRFYQKLGFEPREVRGGRPSGFTPMQYAFY